MNWWDCMTLYKDGVCQITARAWHYGKCYYHDALNSWFFSLFMFVHKKLCWDVNLLYNHSHNFPIWHLPLHCTGQKLTSYIEFSVNICCDLTKQWSHYHITSTAWLAPPQNERNHQPFPLLKCIHSWDEKKHQTMRSPNCC